MVNIMNNITKILTALFISSLTFSNFSYSNTKDDNTFQYEKNINLSYKNSQPYKKYIESQALLNKLPKTIVVIPALESSYTENAVSQDNSRVGMWQLSKHNAISMGLIVNNQVDERLDWKKSTDASIKYIKLIGDKHFNGNYDLAILSLDPGVSIIKRAIKNTNSDDAKVLISDERYLLPKYTKLYKKYLAFSDGYNKLDIKNNIQ